MRAGSFSSLAAGRALRVTALAAICGLTLSACATNATHNQANANAEYGEEIIPDPMEGMNRKVFAFNAAVDKAVMRPVAKGYRAAVPQPVRTGVRNFLNNLRAPITLANQLLQGNLGGAGETVTRTLVNTTVGLGGLIDVAAQEGLKYQHEDFGQTMAVWGAGHGAYMVVPLLGPSSMRDGVGMLVDGLADPLRIYLHNTDRDYLHYTRVGMSVLDKREELLDIMDDLERNSFDYYAAMRSIYTQNRAALVRNQAQGASSLPAMPDYDEYD